MKQLHEKRYFLVAGDPRRIGQAREATSHQYWPPDELKNLVEGEVIHRGFIGRMVRNPFTYVVIILFIYATLRSL